MSTPKPRDASLVPAIGAVVGLSIGLAVASRFNVPPAAGQLPGFALESGFDPKRDIYRLAILVVSSLLGGAVAGIAWRRRRAGPPAGTTASEGADARGARAAVPGILGPAVVAHAITVWTLLAGLLVPLGVWPLALFAAAAGLSFALAVVLGEGSAVEGAPYLGAASPVLALGFLGSGGVLRSVLGAAAALALPALAWGLATRRPQVTRAMRALTLVLLLPGSVTSMAAAAVMRAPRVVNIFEDGHSLLPASEYFRGELPYRDIVPGHGLLSDGLLAFVQLRVFGDDVAGLKRGEKVSGALFWPGFYAVAYAATGSPAFALGGLLFSFVVLPQYQNPRAIVALWLLALALYASRSKRRGAWLAFGAAVPFGLCIAVEFTFYSACAGAVALWVARGRRLVHLRSIALGAAASSALIALCFQAFGILRGFVRTTFVDVPALLPVYAQGFPAPPFPRGAAQRLALFGDETAMLYGFAAFGLVLLGAYLPQAPRVGPRIRALLPICAWVVVAMLSVIERQHVGYVFMVVPIAMLLAARWIRRRRPWLSFRTAAAAVVPALLLSYRYPLSLMSGVAYVTAGAAVPARLVKLDDPPRAHGGLFEPWDAKLMASTAEFMDEALLAPGETWFDFGHAPGLYYFFDRDCPIRYYEPGFYETESAQREVIAAIEANPRVRGALMNAGYAAYVEIDGVPNARRAPLVAAYLAERFRPFYLKGGIEFWLRKESVSAGDPGASGSSPP